MDWSTNTLRVLLTQTTLGKKATIHRVATFQNVIFPGHSHLRTTCTDNPKWLAWWLPSGQCFFGVVLIWLGVTSFCISFWKITLWVLLKWHLMVIFVFLYKMCCLCMLWSLLKGICDWTTTMLYISCPSQILEAVILCCCKDAWVTQLMLLKGAKQLGQFEQH